MKQILITTILLFFISTAHAQKPSKLDSLKNVLAHLPAEGKSFAGDTLRVRVLCEIGGQTGRSSLGDSSLIFLEKALKISKKQNWQEGIAVSYFDIGEFFIIKNEFMKAVDYFYKSLAISIELKDEILIANTYKSLGDCYSLLGNFNKALEFIVKSNTIFKNQKDQKAYIKGLNNLGLMYDDMGKYDKAISVFKSGLTLNQKYHYPKLDTYFKINMGMSQVKKGNYEEALKNYGEVLSDPERNPYNDIYVYISIAEIHEKKEEYTKALAFYEKAKKLIGVSKNNDSHQMLLEEVGYKIFKNTNQPQKALESFILYNEIKQRNTNQDTEKRIKNLQLEFDNQNQKKQIESWKKNVMFAVGGISVLLILGALLFSTNKKLERQNRTIELQSNKIEKANKQLEEFNLALEEKVELRTQELSKANADLLKKNDEIMAALVEGQTLERKRVSAELHDNLGSTISGIKYRLQALDLADFTEKEKVIYTSVMQMMNDAYSEVRLISHNLLPDEFEKKGLKGALEKLVNDINLSGKFKLSLIYKEPKILLPQKIAIELYSICLELVNNMIKHSAGTEGEIYLFSNTNNIILDIRDNGGNADNLSEGFGLKNIKTRVSRLNGTLEILTSLSETEIVVQVPVVVLNYQKYSGNKHTA
jgi:signal transduction histidine kinase